MFRVKLQNCKPVNVIFLSIHNAPPPPVISYLTQTSSNITVIGYRYYLIGLVLPLKFQFLFLSSWLLQPATWATLITLKNPRVIFLRPFSWAVRYVKNIPLDIHWALILASFKSLLKCDLLMKCTFSILFKRKWQPASHLNSSSQHSWFN